MTLLQLLFSFSSALIDEASKTHESGRNRSYDSRIRFDAADEGPDQ